MLVPAAVKKAASQVTVIGLVVATRLVNAPVSPKRKLHAYAGVTYPVTSALSVIAAGIGAVAFRGTIRLVAVPGLMETLAPVTRLAAENSSSLRSFNNVAIKLVFLYQFFHVTNLVLWIQRGQAFRCLVQTWMLLV